MQCIDDLWNTIYIPAVLDRDNACLPLCDLHEGGLSHVEMSSWGVTPSTSVRVFGPVGWAEVCCCDRSNTFGTPWRLDTLNLITLPTCISICKDCRAQCCCISSIPVGHNVSISTSTPYTKFQQKKNNQHLHLQIVKTFGFRHTR